MDDNQNGIVLAEREEPTETVVAPPSEEREPLMVEPREISPKKNTGPRHGKQREPKPLWLRILGWIGVGLGGVVALAIVFCLIVFYTPLFPEWRSQYIMMTYHTSNSWLCTTFFSQETIEAVLAENGTEAPEGQTNPDLIVTPDPDVPEPEFSASEKYPGDVIYDDGEVQVLEFSGTTKKGVYTARLIQIKDPSRVFLGVTDKLGKRGQLIADMCETSNALCGINAGGFKDEGGVGSGGIPTELVIKDSVITVYDEDDQYEIIGFNQDNVLVLGEYTYEQLQALQLRDAISWGALSWSPFLIMNGEKATFKGTSGGYDPRAAIGQRADGVALLLVVDGSAKRGVDGANMELVADILWEYGAVNAANLDGGTSASMALQGQLINTVCNPVIAGRGRYLATGWLVEHTPESAANEITDYSQATNARPTTTTSETVTSTTVETTTSHAGTTTTSSATTATSATTSSESTTVTSSATTSFENTTATSSSVTEAGSGTTTE